MNKLALIVLLVGLAACSSKKPEEGREPPQTAPGSVVGSAAPAAPAPGPGNAAAPGPGNAAAPGPGNAAAPGPGNAAAPGPGNAAAPGPGSAPTGSSAPGSAASSPGVGCATATTLVCDAGQGDGCTGGLTSVHVCVAKDAKAGPPCAQELALACPAGQVDACLHDPPQATNHVCVIVPRS